MNMSAFAGAFALALAAHAAGEKTEAKTGEQAALEMVKPHALTTDTYLDSAMNFAKSAYTAADMERPQKEVVDANIKELKNAVEQADQHAAHVTEMLPAQKKMDISQDLQMFKSELGRVKMALQAPVTDSRQAKMTLSQVWPHLTKARDAFDEISSDIDIPRLKEPAPAQMQRGQQPGY